MVHKQDARRSTRAMLAKQCCTKNRKRFLKTSKRDRFTNKASVANELKWLVGDENMFADDVFHGNTTWEPSELVSQALIWSLQETKNVTDAFEYSLKFCDKLGMKQTAKTYPRFMNALTRYKVLSARVRSRVQQRAEEVGGRFWRDNDWVLFAFDGSRVSVPRTVSNENAFCASNYGKGKTAKYRKKKTKGMRRTKNEKAKPQPQGPQIWITMVWHMGLRLPWTWRLGPSNSSERRHVEEILNAEQFPEKSLFCGDAGFVGFPLWAQLILAKAEFLVRVGGNVSLLSEHATIERLKDNVVLCWPKDKMRSGDKPLRLRLVKIKIGKTTMWMVTSVLDRKKLSIKQIIRYYKMRWGIEVEFRGLKQTLDNHNLCCRNSENATAELEWSILAMTVAELLALRRQIPKKRKKNDDRDYRVTEYRVTDRSLAETVRAIRSSLASPNDIPEPGKGLIDQLAKAIVQRYNNTTDKKSRYRPPNPDKQPLKGPDVRKINAIERKKLREVDMKVAA
jgi:Transposase DDE domain